MAQSRHAAHPRVLMIGNAHIDPVWLWRRDEGRREVLDTARTVVTLMGEYPEMTFTFGQAQSYLWIEEDDPALFESIRGLVAEGRWHVVGGMWVQPDCNLSSGESFARQMLYSQRYFRSRFGVAATVGYNVDSFGHAGTLPQLLRKGGMDCYVYFRPDPEHEVALDEDLYWWQSPDGSQVLAYRPPNHYCTWAGGIERWTTNSIAHAPERVGEVICFYGVGNHGGGPTRENLESIRALAARDDLPPIEHGSLAAYFAHAREVRGDYSVRRADLQHHAAGCYSAHSDIKRWNRRAEQELAAVEKANAVLAALGGGALAGTMAFEETWRPVLFNQFHDILAGTSIAEAYEDSAGDFAEVSRMCRGMEQVVLERLSEMTDCRGGGRPILAFNSCSWRREAIVELDFPGQSVALDGQPLLGQRSHDDKLLASVPLPAMGAACMHVGQQGGAPAATTVSAGDCFLENEFWRLSLDSATGEWQSLYDKANDVDVLAAPANALVVLDDPSDTWSHGVRGYHTEVGRFGGAEVLAVEHGPVRASLLVTRRYGHSLARERVSLYAGQRTIEVSATLDWHETRKALKLSFPVAVGYPVCSYEAPYGVTTRVANGEEEPGQTWVDASGVSRSRSGRAIPYGVSLINDSKYGFDMKSHGGYADDAAWTDLRMTILRSPPYAFHDPRPFDPDETYRFMEQGEQRFSYWLLPHAGSWREAGTVRLAHERNTSLLTLSVRAHQGALPASWSFLECEQEGVEVAVLKLAEDGGFLVLRLHETSGSDTTAALAFPLWGMRAEVPLGHHEVKTLRLSRSGDRLLVEETDLLEEPQAAGFHTEVRLGDL